MVKANDHPVTIILRDWSKTKKGNSRPVAEIHSRKETKNSKKFITTAEYCTGKQLILCATN